jgi:two-component system sensor histidine kinase QseC
LLDVEFSSTNDVRELVGIRSRLDELIERLGSALERERRFTSAAAHELRTPLAELKTLAQVSDRWPEDHELRGRVPRDVLALTARMQNTVESLLSFARATRESPDSNTERVDLSSMLSRLVESNAPGAGEGRARISSSIEPALIASRDPTIIESVLRNLLDNAIAHGGKTSPISVRARRDGDSIVVEMENARGDLSESDLRHLFEPFWRKDSSRHGDRHSGLGLALVDAWVKSWGGTIRAELVAPDLVRFSLRLPGAQSIGANQ